MAVLPVQAWGSPQRALFEEAAITEVAFEKEPFLFGARNRKDTDEPLEGAHALVAVSAAGLASALRLATVCVAILVGTTVPPEFGAAAALSIPEPRRSRTADID